MINPEASGGEQTQAHPASLGVSTDAKKAGRPAVGAPRMLRGERSENYLPALASRRRSLSTTIAIVSGLIDASLTRLAKSAGFILKTSVEASPASCAASATRTALAWRAFLM